MPASSDTPSSRTVSSETLTAASGKLDPTQVNRRIVPGPIIRNGWALSHTSVKDQQLFLHFVRYAPVQVPSNRQTCRVHFDKEDEIITYYPHHPPLTHLYRWNTPIALTRFHPVHPSRYDPRRS